MQYSNAKVQKHQYTKRRPIQIQMLLQEQFLISVHV